MRESNVNTTGRLYPKTKNYYQKVFFRKIFGKNLYKFFKVLKIILFYKLGKSFEISEFLKQIIEKDFVIFDVGANLGQYAIRFGKKLYGEGKLISIEPVYDDFLYLQKIKKRYKLNNIECRNYAVSDYEGESTLYIPVIENDIELDTRATIDFNNYYFNYKKYITQKVNVITLHSLFTEMKLSKIDIIKSDTEGNDSKVLSGSIDLIKRFYPLILIEDSHKEQWLKNIYDIGYLPFYVINSLFLINADKTTGNEKNIKYDLLVLIHQSKKQVYNKYIKGF
jgi:FkbM family methyltransferase